MTKINWDKPLRTKGDKRECRLLGEALHPTHPYVVAVRNPYINEDAVFAYDANGQMYKDGYYGQKDLENFREPVRLEGYVTIYMNNGRIIYSALYDEHDDARKWLEGYNQKTKKQRFFIIDLSKLTPDNIEEVE